MICYHCGEEAGDNCVEGIETLKARADADKLEVERLRALIPTCDRGPKACDAEIAQLKLERDAYKKAKHEADERLMLAADDIDRMKRERDAALHDAAEDRLGMKHLADLVSELEARLANKDAWPQPDEQLAIAENLVEDFRARITELEEVLQPFAETYLAHPSWDRYRDQDSVDPEMAIGDFRAAVRVLEKKLPTREKKL